MEWVMNDELIKLYVKNEMWCICGVYFKGGKFYDDCSEINGVKNG